MQQRQYVTIQLIDAFGRITGLIHRPVHSRFDNLETESYLHGGGHERRPDCRRRQR